MSDSHRALDSLGERGAGTSSCYENLQDNDHNFCMYYAVNVLSMGTLGALIEIYNYLNLMLLPETDYVCIIFLSLTNLYNSLLAFSRLTYIAVAIHY